MPTVTIATSATLTTNGDARTITHSATVDCGDVTTGRQTVGNTYEEVISLNGGGAVAAFIYNDGEVDISVRLTLQYFTTNDYVFFTVPPGALFSVPYVFLADNNQPSRVTYMSARSESGTCDIDYCLLT